MSKLELRNLSKVYEDNIEYVKSINIEARENEFLVLVGPSGCGKTTTLRMIAGLEKITSGEILINDKRINELEAKDRNIAMVFQNYALYPHMTVYDNIAFSHKIKKTKKNVIKEKIEKIAKNLEITEILEKKPSTLSGGQKQRVALARAIIREPSIFLMDEPLSNLDSKLRVLMRTEIIRLHKRLNTSFVYVTHDQIEAMTMGERIVVMNDGEIMQIDTPEQIYKKPKNLFVAEFIGSPKINSYYYDKSKNNSSIKNIEKFEEIAKSKNKKLEDTVICFRAEDINLEHETPDIIAEIELIENLGYEKLVYLKNGFVIKINSEKKLESNTKVAFGIETSKIHVFDRDTGLRL